MKHAKILLPALCLILLTSYAQAMSIPVDLRTFYADPTAVVSSDGSFATLTEDPERFTVFLSNDPDMGDPGIAIPPGLLALRFTYSFSLSENCFDNFYVKVFDGTTGATIKDFLVEGSDSGTVSWDLTGIGSGMTILGLEFQLNSNDSAFGTFVDISTVELQIVSVSEPYTLVLLGCGLAGLVSLRRKLAQ